MNTVKLYDNDSYIKSFTATVLQCEKNNDKYRIVLDKTAFFPEGGGQFSDTGVIGDAKVYDVQIENGIIYHYCNSPLRENEQYDAEINFPERFDKMQQHSGEHIVSGLIHKQFGYENVGFHLGNDFITMDFDGELSDEQLSVIELLANKAITDNVRIYAEYPDKDLLSTINYRSKGDIDGEVRLVFIDGVDICACCAPHVNKSGEIGVIRFLYHEKNKGGIRIYAKCGMRAIKDIQTKYSNNSKISALLCAKADETAEAVENLLAEIGKYKYEITGLKRQIAELKVDALPKGQTALCLFENGLNTADMRYLANKAAEKCDIFGVFSKNRIGFSYVCYCSLENISQFAKTFNEKLGGKGGVSGNILQGSVTADKDTIEEFFKCV